MGGPFLLSSILIWLILRKSRVAMERMRGIQGVLCLGTCLCLMNVQSQNLIPNPSFEEYESCPVELGNFHEDVIAWQAPTLGSTDYFNNCSTVMGTPKNFNGEQVADFGQAYAGLYLYAPDDYREYMHIELKETLKEGVPYEFSFFVSLAERSDFAIKDFGVLFSSGPIEVKTRRVLSKMHLYRDTKNKYHFLEIKYSEFYKDKKDWVKVQTAFIAKGTERYITLGNFRNNPKTRNLITKRNAKQGAYYYIDKVALFTPPTEGLPEAQAKDIPLDQPLVFEHVHFPFDAYTLHEEAKSEIQSLFRYLESDTALHLTISGHTDDRGSDGYNKRLSASRCKAVIDYLITLGLNKNRVAWEAFGGTQPIADNTSESGRQKNRRVEFTISRMAQ